MPCARTLVEDRAPSPASAKLMVEAFDSVWASVEPAFADQSKIDEARVALARSVLDFYRAGITERGRLQRMCLRSMKLSRGRTVPRLHRRS
jgi:hypothetical protein